MRNSRNWIFASFIVSLLIFQNEISCLFRDSCFQCLRRVDRTKVHACFWSPMAQKGLFVLICRFWRLVKFCLRVFIKFSVLFNLLLSVSLGDLKGHSALNIFHSFLRFYRAYNMRFLNIEALFQQSWWTFTSLSILTKFLLRCHSESVCKIAHPIGLSD